MTLFHEVIIWALVVNEEITKLFVSQEMNNYMSLFFALIAKILVKHSFHLLLVGIIEKHKFRTIFPNFFRYGMKILRNQNERNLFMTSRKGQFCNFTPSFKNVLRANNVIEND